MLPFLLLIVFGLIQYGLYFFSAQTGSNTVNVAARQLTVGNCDTTAELQARSSTTGWARRKSGPPRW